MEERAEAEGAGYLLSLAASMTGPPCRAEPSLEKEGLVLNSFTDGLTINSHGEWGEG